MLDYVMLIVQLGHRAFFSYSYNDQHYTTDTFEFDFIEQSCSEAEREFSESFNED